MTTPLAEPPPMPGRREPAPGSRRAWAAAVTAGVIVFVVAELAARAGANRLIAAMVTALVMVTALLLVASYVARQRRYEQDTLRGLRDRSEAGATLNAEVSGLNATLRTALPAEKG